MRLTVARPVSIALALFATISVATPAISRADPISDANRSVEELRRDADRASGTYFDALTQYETLERDLADIESQLPELRARAARLRERAVDRAVVAYVHRVGDLDSLLGSEGVLTAARRTQWLDRLNSHDNAVYAELDQARKTLDDRRRQLDELRAQRADALEQVKAQGAEIDAKLSAAVQRSQTLQAQGATNAAPTTNSSSSAPKSPGTAPKPPPSSQPTPGPAPKPPPNSQPPNYQPTPGAHPNHDDPFLVCTRARESSGNYGAINPAGPYLGAYQFLQSTWNSGANHLGRPELIGVPPNTVSQYDQDDVAWSVYQWRGAGPWGSHCT